jgi:hypothetical protein
VRIAQCHYRASQRWNSSRENASQGKLSPGKRPKTGAAGEGATSLISHKSDFLGVCWCEGDSRQQASFPNPCVDRGLARGDDATQPHGCIRNPRSSAFIGGPS